jgi:hypothetical protein
MPLGNLFQNDVDRVDAAAKILLQLGVRERFGRDFEVLQDLLGVLGHAADFGKEVREIRGIFAFDGAALGHRSGAGRTARELDHLVAEKPLVGDLGDGVLLHTHRLAFGDVDVDVEAVVGRVVGVSHLRDISDVDAAEPDGRARLEPLHVAEARVIEDLRFEETLFLADQKDDDSGHDQPGEHEDPHPHLLGTRHLLDP